MTTPPKGRPPRVQRRTIKQWTVATSRLHTPYSSPRTVKVIRRGEGTSLRRRWAKTAKRAGSSAA
jgi:hypothetical protein